MSDDATTAAEVIDSIRSVLGRHGEMVTRVVAVIETINAEGERAVWTAVPDDSKAWDNIGLLDYALTLERVGLNSTS